MMRLQYELRNLLMAVNPQVQLKDSELDWIVDEVSKTQPPMLVLVLLVELRLNQ
jgi:hypothetical protein